MNEEYLFLDVAGEQLLACAHHPAGRPSRALVICHPLGEEKLWAHRTLVSFARAAAAAGLFVLRFDFRGEGDSARDFKNSDFDSRIEDTCRAVDAARAFHETVSDVAVLGLRFGACVAASTAARRADVARLVLWDPILDGAAYMQSVLRLNLMYQMALHRRIIEDRDAMIARLERGETINIEGYEFSDALFKQASAFRLQNTLAQYKGNTVIVQINSGATTIRPEFTDLSSMLGSGAVLAVQEELFWREVKTFCQQAPNLTNATLRALGVTP